MTKPMTDEEFVDLLQKISDSLDADPAIDACTPIEEVEQWLAERGIDVTPTVEMVRAHLAKGQTKQPQQDSGKPAADE